jgi:hypothetical protein
LCVADLKISELTPAGSVAGSDILPIVAGGANFSATISQIASAVTVPPATTSTAGTISAADKTKLDGIATGATANSSDATLLNRANHIGTQLASTISNFSEATDDRVAALLVAGTNITLTYNDGANTLTIAAAGGGGGVSDGDKGDITVSSSGTVWTVDNDSITTAKLANMATATIRGRVTAGTGDPEDLTGTQVTTLLDVFTPSLKGLAPSSGGGTSNFLRADGTWAAPSGGGGGVAPSYILQNTDRTLTSTTAAQQIFNQTTNGRITLTTGLYEFQLLIDIDTMSATSGNATFSLVGAGTATAFIELAQAVGIDNNNELGTGARTGDGMRAGAGTLALASSATGTAVLSEIYGTFEVTVAGTLIPSIALDTAVPAVVRAGTFMRITKLGNAGVYASGDFD